MDALVEYLGKEGLDVSALDETIADYVIQLAKEGGTEDETWSVLEGCYPELEESSKSRASFSDLLVQLRDADSKNKGNDDDNKSRCSSSPGEMGSLGDVTGSGHQSALPGEQWALPRHQNSKNRKGALSGFELGRTASVGGAVERANEDEEDVEFLREMMPNVSDRGLRYVLHGLAKGSRVAAASYLADCCTGGGAARSSTSLEGLEVKAEAFEHRKLENARKAEEVSKIKQEAKMRDKEERDALKGKIVARYADEAEGSVVNAVLPSLKEKKQMTRYRDGKVVTTTGAKVIAESVKPEWDGGSRGKVKSKGKRGKGFV